MRLEYFRGRGFRCMEVEESVAAFFQGAWTQLGLEHYSLVHSHGFTVGAAAAIPARLRGVPHLMTAHDVFLWSQFQGWKGTVKRRLLNRLFNLIDCIHAVSEDGAKNLFEFMPLLRHERVAAILNGIDCELFAHAAPRDFRSALGLGDDRVLIGFFGRFMSQKGFRYLVGAIALLERDAEVSRKPLVLTFGQGGFAKEEQIEIDRSGLSQYFLNLPHTDEVAEAMRGVDIVAMPSLWEACGLVAMEALVAAAPIIGTNCLGLREVLKDSPADLVAPRDAYALKESLKSYINQPRNSEFSEFAPRALERFDRRLAASKLRDLYEHLSR